MLDPSSNAFLKGLDQECWEKLLIQMDRVELELTQIVYKQGKTVDWVYFPTQSLISLISLNEAGQTIETSMAGKEACAGLLEACGSGQCSVDAVVQVDGPAWRAPASHCRALAFQDMAFNAAAWRVAELQLTESRQSGLCHATHPVQSRAARWLLECMERSGGRNPLPMTQEFLAAMLGVQRTTVSQVAGDLKSRGLITYTRGQLRIVDPLSLENLACNCRRASRDQRARLNLSVPHGPARV